MPIEGVVFEPGGADVNKDDRRVLISSYNSDVNGGFSFGATKAIVMERDAELGGDRGHYHLRGRELWGFARGGGIVLFEDVKTGERVAYKLSEGDRIIIPTQVAHRFWLRAETILEGGTEEPYSEGNTVHHPIEIESWESVLEQYLENK